MFSYKSIPYVLNQAHAWFLEIASVREVCVCVCVCVFVCVSAPKVISN